MRLRIPKLALAPTLLVVASALFGAEPAIAQFISGIQVIDNSGQVLTVRELSLQGAHFEALSRYDALGEEQRTLAERLAAAKSAWALGLVDRARSYWDEALASKSFVGSERERELLARAILELQEGKLEEARARAERASVATDSDEMRAQFWLVTAEALKNQGALSQAENYYRRAVEASSGDSKNEALFLLAECQLKLGLVNDARYNFANVEMHSKYVSRSLRRLAEIDLSQRNYEGVLTWVTEGRESSPQEFEDPWVGYANVTALSELRRERDAKAELERMRTRYSDKDTWVALAEAKLEGQEHISSTASVNTRQQADGIGVKGQ